MKIVIKDWTGRILSYKGYFELVEFCVPMEFKKFEDAYDYIQEVLYESEDDVYVDTIKG